MLLAHHSNPDRARGWEALREIEPHRVAEVLGEVLRAGGQLAIPVDDARLLRVVHFPEVATFLEVEHEAENWSVVSKVDHQVVREVAYAAARDCLASALDGLDVGWTAGPLRE